MKKTLIALAILLTGCTADDECECRRDNYTSDWNFNYTFTHSQEWFCREESNVYEDAGVPWKSFKIVCE